MKPKLDTARQDTLRSGQLAWLRSRNESCSKYAGGSFFINLQCATDTTVQRTKFLQARYRECVSSGCMDSRLAQ